MGNRHEKILQFPKRETDEYKSPEKIKTEELQAYLHDLNNLQNWFYTNNIPQLNKAYIKGNRETKHKTALKQALGRLTTLKFNHTLNELANFIANHSEQNPITFLEIDAVLNAENPLLKSDDIKTGKAILAINNLKLAIAQEIKKRTENAQA